MDSALPFSVTLRDMYGSAFRAFTGSTDLHEVKRTFAHARVIIGPHGGAFTNLIFAPNRTIVIEYMPCRRNGRHFLVHGGMMMYHMAAMLNHDYWRIPVVSQSSDFHVNVDELLQLLRRIAPTDTLIDEARGARPAQTKPGDYVAVQKSTDEASRASDADRPAEWHYTYDVVRWPRINFISPKHRELTMLDPHTRAWFDDQQ